MIGLALDALDAGVVLNPFLVLWLLEPEFEANAGGLAYTRVVEDVVAAVAPVLEPLLDLLGVDTFADAFGEVSIAVEPVGAVARDAGGLVGGRPPARRSRRGRERPR